MASTSRYRRSAPQFEDSNSLPDEDVGLSSRGPEDAVLNRGQNDPKPNSAMGSSHLHVVEQVSEGQSLRNPLSNYHNSASLAKVTIVSQGRDLEEDAIPRFMTGDLSPKTAAELPSFLYNQLDTSDGVAVM